MQSNSRSTLLATQASALAPIGTTLSALLAALVSVSITSVSAQETMVSSTIKNDLESSTQVSERNVTPVEDEEEVTAEERSLVYSYQRDSLMKKGTAGKFDYYLLAMSWSPDYCLTHTSDTQQCGRKFGFIIHGLWPENLSGANPSNCASQQSLTQQAIDIALPFMPSKSLINHEWTTHGVCAGTSATTYFSNAVNAFKAINLPSYLANPQTDTSHSLSALRSDFSQSSGLANNQFAVVCDGNRLKEIRVCLSKQFGAQACGTGVSDTCPANITVNAPR